MSETARTPLHDRHVRLGARMVPFAGWEMPLLYRGIIPEHLHTRMEASVFDICHMGEFELSGPTAEQDLERLLTQSVASIPAGGCAYGYLLDDSGGVLDDLICYRFDKRATNQPGAEKFWLVVNAGTTAADARWIAAHLSPRTVFRDISARTAKLDIQGPRARELAARAMGVELPDLGYFRFQPVEICGAACVLSRTGYTGEFGYELYIPVEEAGRIWDCLLANGQILPAGLGARDTLRVEMGYPLYGHELGPDRSPAGVARGKFMDLSKPFIGRDRVLRDLDNPGLPALAGLRLEGRMAARAGDKVFDGDVQAGVVTSGLFAPSLGVAVALGLIDRRLVAPGRKLSVVSRSKKLAVEIVKLPFYKEGTARREKSSG